MTNSFLKQTWYKLRRTLRIRNRWRQHLFSRISIIITSIILGTIIRGVADALGFSSPLEFLSIIGSITVLSVALLLEDNLKEIDKKVEKMGSAYYIEASENQGGSAYNELTKLFENAKFEFLAVSPASLKTFQGTEYDSEDRKHYYDTMTAIVKDHIDLAHNFTYIRIFQMDEEDKLIWETHGDTVSRHCLSLIEAREVCVPGSKPNVIFKKMPTQRGHGFLVIDKRIVVIIVDGYERRDGNNSPYHAGYIVIEGGKIVKEFENRFHELEAHGEISNVGRMEFEDWKPNSNIATLSKAASKTQT